MKQNIGDIIAPPSIAFSFEAPGWKILLLVVIILLLIIIVKKRINWKKQLYRRQALDLMSLLDNQDLNYNTCSRVNKILRRTANTAYSIKEIPSCGGETWINFLNSKLSSKQSFNIQYYKMIEQYIYSQNMPEQLTSEQLTEFYNYGKIWIKQHAI